MTTPTQQSEYQSRLLWLLAVVTDGSRGDRARLAAIKAVQQMLPDGNPLRLEEPNDLLDRLLQPWESRSYLVNGRSVMRTVSRPPASLRDAWR